jgi:hypothetical protein
MGVFQEVQRFAEHHQACGELTIESRFPPDAARAAAGYQLALTCPCGQSWQRWVTPMAAHADLVHSDLLASVN